MTADNALNRDILRLTANLGPLTAMVPGFESLNFRLYFKGKSCLNAGLSRSAGGVSSVAFAAGCASQPLPFHCTF